MLTRNHAPKFHITPALMASCVEIDRCNLIPLSPCACQSRRPSSSSAPKTLFLSRRSSPSSSLRLFFDASREIFRVPRVVISANYRQRPHHRSITAVASAEPDRLDQDQSHQKVDKGRSLLMEEDPPTEPQQKAVAVAAAAFVAAREYFELVRSRGIAAGMTPPPRYVSQVCSVICTLMPILTLYFGQIDVSVTSAAFIVAITLLLQRGNPRFAQLSSTIFGLFYCGYLPCFWIKLRCGLAAPALNTRVGRVWPLLLGGHSQWTVGLVATLISVSSIIAADTYAFVGGKAFGRTPLINISPKKTWEGAVLGLGGCIATSVLLSRILSWPTSVLRGNTRQGR